MLCLQVSLSSAFKSTGRQMGKRGLEKKKKRQKTPHTH